jgi:xanthine/uracil permease
VQWLPAQIVLMLAGLAGLIALGALWLRSSGIVAVAWLFLAGSTVPGYLLASFVVAPALTGYQSHDTTPWTETIVGATTAAAGVAMLVAALVSAVRRRR